MRLFHFSEDPSIERFVPRPVRVPSERPPGREWLNGPLVWAIEDAYQAMYLFPRECPRVLYWPTAATTDADRDRWWGHRTARFVAAVEWAWVDRLATGSLMRYEMPASSFVDLEDAGMWVSASVVTPVAVERVANLPRALREQGVELLVVERLSELPELRKTTLHVSSIRMRNAQR